MESEEFEGVKGGETIGLFRNFKLKEEAEAWVKIEEARLDALGYRVINFDYLPDLASVYASGEGWCGFVDAEKLEYIEDEATN